MKYKAILICLTIVVIFSCKKKEKKSEEMAGPQSPPTTCDTNHVFALELNGNVIDESCNPVSCTSNNLNYVNDRNGNSIKAISFNGTSSSLQLPNTTKIHPNFPFTVAFWVNPTDSSATSNYFVQSQAGSNYFGYWIHAVPGSGQVVANFGDGSGNTSASRRTQLSSYILRSNMWTHVSIVYSSATQTKMFFNGVEDLGSTGSGSATSIVYEFISNTSAIGRIGGYFSTAPFYFSGKMDKVKIWKKALSQTEIQNEYSSTN